MCCCIISCAKLKSILKKSIRSTGMCYHSISCTNPKSVSQEIHLKHWDVLLYYLLC
jgi:hypothetical protein